MSTENIKALAGALTTAFWSNSGNAVCAARREDGTIYVELWKPVAVASSNEYAKYIAAVDPVRVLAMISELEQLRAELAALKQRRPTVEIRQVNDGFALYEAERLVRGGFDRRHTAMLWALDQGLSVHTDNPIEMKP